MKHANIYLLFRGFWQPPTDWWKWWDPCLMAYEQKGPFQKEISPSNHGFSGGHVSFLGEERTNVQDNPWSLPPLELVKPRYIAPEHFGISSSNSRKVGPKKGGGFTQEIQRLLLRGKKIISDLGVCFLYQLETAGLFLLQVFQVPSKSFTTDFEGV